MTVVFIGGSRAVSQLPPAARDHLREVVRRGDDVVVGDAAGADKLAQRLLYDLGSVQVKVFCAGGEPRHNIGAWPVEQVPVPRGTRDFQRFAVKDRAMARLADCGLMIWDGLSVGTLLNVLRLVRAGKPATIVDARSGAIRLVESERDWIELVSPLGRPLLDEMRAKAVAGEWIALPGEQTELVAQPDLMQAAIAPPVARQADRSEDATALNDALATGDLDRVQAALRTRVDAVGTHLVARRMGLPPKRFSTILAPGGKPSFVMVLHLLHALDLSVVTAPAARPRPAVVRPKRPALRAENGADARAEPDLVSLALGPR